MKVHFFIKVAIRVSTLPLESKHWHTLPCNALSVSEWRESLMEIEAVKGNSQQEAAAYYTQAVKALKDQYGSRNIRILSGMLKPIEDYTAGTQQLVLEV